MRGKGYLAKKTAQNWPQIFLTFTPPKGGNFHKPKDLVNQTYLTMSRIKKIEADEGKKASRSRVTCRHTARHIFKTRS